MGKDDWEQVQLGDGAQGAITVWIHKLCGELIGSSYTNVHEKLCPASKK